VPIHPLELDGGRGTIQSRETSGNLSGSGSETHQHFWPTGATCCQSLLLDPDATMLIDLHKRLFLLVTGRGEYAQVFPYHGCALPTELGGQVTVLQLEVDIVAAIHSTCPRRWRTRHGTGHEHPVPKHRHRRDRQGPATELDPRRLAWLGRPLLCWSCDARTSSTCTASGWHLSPAR
jgi:hypothetical protein